VSIVAGEDSPLCQVVGPPLTVVKRDIVGFGAQAARMLFEILETGTAAGVQAVSAHLEIRRSTGPAGY
jgi:DNA-binding LacI/PurR family transcriptional regulator